MTPYAHLLAEPLSELRALTEVPVDRDRAHHALHQAIVLLEEACVHDTRNAVARLRALDAQLPPVQRAFDEALLAIFAGLGDRHTQAYLPDPFFRRVAFLPFLAEEAYDARGRRRYIITASAHDELRRGEELVAWNGAPIAEALAAHQAEHFGRTARARHAQVVQMLTFRPLSWMPLPAPEVEVTAGKRRVRLAWQIAAAEGMSRLAPFFGFPDSDDFFVEGFRADTVTTEHGTFARLRISSINEHPNDILGTYAAALRTLPQDGLILDVRRCERGIITGAENLLQLFTDAPVTPMRFQFRITPLIRDLVARSQGLEAWRDDVESAARRGARYSRPRPLVPEPATSDYRYPGPVAVLTSGLTYSSAEMFAAGIQDHGLGTIVGTAPATGGGGASPWPQVTINRLSLREDLRPIDEAPSFRIAVRRALRRDGRPLEGSGVRPDVFHKRTLRDVMDGDMDLLNVATAILAEKSKTR
jgi:hypothetical protein